uniref:LolYLWc n=1 Tax=Bichromomyia olmeca TaxID=715919 RepID=A0A1B1V3I2_9DIPT|nr:LolYLWc [Bichromomyia olmeca]
MFYISFLAVILFQGIHGAYVEIEYSWSNITYEGLDIKSYKPRYNVPTAFAYDAVNHKLFLTIPRRLPYVPYTVAELDTIRHPGFPVERAPQLSKFSGKSKKDFVPVYQPVIDECRRLWILDVGAIEYNGDDANKYPKQKPALIVHDLTKNNNPEIARYEIPKNVAAKPTAFGGFAVDVNKKNGDCSQTFVYITNFEENSLVVFNQKTKTSWKFTDKTFRPDKESTFSHLGDQTTYKVGIFGITLGDRDKKGDRPAYYIAGSSTKVYSINTKQLKTKGTKLKPKLHGDRGKHTDAIALAYDAKHRVIFFAESDTRQVSCWHIDMPLKPENTDVIYSYARFIFGTDISIDSENNLWFLSNGYPPIENAEKLKFYERKIRLMRVDTDIVLKHAKCNLNYKKPQEIPV